MPCAPFGEHGILLMSQTDRYISCCVRAIFEHLHRAQKVGAKLGVDKSVIMWGCLQGRQLGLEFTQDGFSSHPVVQTALNKHMQHRVVMQDKMESHLAIMRKEQEGLMKELRSLKGRIEKTLKFNAGKLEWDGLKGCDSAAGGTQAKYQTALLGLTSMFDAPTLSNEDCQPPYHDPNSKAEGETQCTDNDYGEQFLNFPLHPNLCKYCGADLSQLLEDNLENREAYCATRVGCKMLPAREEIGANNRDGAMGSTKKAGCKGVTKERCVKLQDQIWWTATSNNCPATLFFRLDLTRAYPVIQ
eukprot:jgi/Psemu1/777/gm1.777_g